MKGSIRQILLTLVLAVNAPALAADGAREYLHFVEIPYGGNCSLHRGNLMLIENTHPGRAIKVQLQHYLGKVRQAGRNIKVLKPGAEPTSLGCTRVSELDQRWKIVEAEFQD